MDPQRFCCTTLRDVIFTERCSVSVMSTTIVYYTCSGMMGHRREHNGGTQQSGGQQISGNKLCPCGGATKGPLAEDLPCQVLRPAVEVGFVAWGLGGMHGGGDDM